MTLQIYRHCLGFPWNGLKRLFPKIVGMKTFKTSLPSVDTELMFIYVWKPFPPMFCRTLVANALRKKQFHKEAIRVEVIPSGVPLDANKPFSGDWFKWDPISSGEGDLLLEDMAKSFSASTKVSKTVKALDFASVIDSMPSYGFQVKALISQTEAVPQPPDNGKDFLSAAEVVEVSAAASGLPEQLDRLDLRPEPDQTSSYDFSLIHQISGCENSQHLYSPSDTTKALINSEEIRTPTTTSKEEKENPNGSDVNLSLNVAEKHDLQLQLCVANFESHIVPENEYFTFHASAKDLELDAPCDADAKRQLPTLSEDIVLPSPTNEESKSTKSSDVVLGFDMEGVDVKNQENTSLALNDLSLHEQFPEREQYREIGNDAAILTEHLPISESYIDMRITDDASVANHESAEVTMEEQRHGEADAEVHHPTLVQSISGNTFNFCSGESVACQPYFYLILLCENCMIAKHI
jgi:ribonuclease P/MRP protein subunit RPP1